MAAMSSRSASVAVRVLNSPGMPSSSQVTRRPVSRCPALWLAGGRRHTGGVSIEPDTKDWTWVLERPCPECSFDSATVDPARLPDALRATARRWRLALTDPGCTVRPSDNVWSPLEYACHVRDVHRIFDPRVARMLAEDDP